MVTPKDPQESSPAIRVLALTLFLAALGALFYRSPQPQSQPPQPEPLATVNIATSAEPIQEALPPITIKMGAPPKQPPKVTRPTPVAKAKPAPDKPKTPTQVTKPRKVRNYPKAKPRAKATPPPQRIAANTPKPIPKTPQKAPGTQVQLGAEVSWDSLPASGSRTNGYLQFEIKPGKTKTKSEIKRNLVVLLDVSGSMRLPVEDIVTPVILLMNRLGPEDRGVVVTFSDRAKVFHAKTTVPTYKRKVAPLTRSRRTDLMVGIKAALEEIPKGHFQNRVDQLVVMTDGLTSGPGGERRKRSHDLALIQLCKEAGVPLTIFGYGAGCDRTLLQRLAHDSKGTFTYATSVSDLLESVMGDVIGLSGVITRDNRLIINLTQDIKVNRAYLLGPNGRDLGQVATGNRRVEIPLGKLSEGEVIKVALEVVLPSGEVGVAELAQAKVEYKSPEGDKTTTRPVSLKVRYTGSQERARHNKKTADIVPQIQKM